MIYENVISAHYNNITGADKQFEFMTDDDRPALVRLKDERVFLYIGEKGKNRVEDGSFVIILPTEARDYSWKLDDAEPREWSSVAKRLKTISVSFVD